MGRDAFEKAVTDPESVESLKSRADVEDIFFAEFLTVPDQAYQAKTGKALPVSPKGKAVPSGKEWKTEDDLKHRFSRLFAKYFGSA